MQRIATLCIMGWGGHKCFLHISDERWSWSGWGVEGNHHFTFHGTSWDISRFTACTQITISRPKNIIFTVSRARNGQITDHGATSIHGFTAKKIRFHGFTVTKWPNHESRQPVGGGSYANWECKLHDYGLV